MIGPEIAGVGGLFSGLKNVSHTVEVIIAGGGLAVLLKFVETRYGWQAKREENARKERDGLIAENTTLRAAQAALMVASTEKEVHLLQKIATERIACGDRIYALEREVAALKKAVETLRKFHDGGTHGKP